MNKKPTYEELYQMYTDARETATLYEHLYHKTEHLLDEFIIYCDELQYKISECGLH
jgi:hypothetical protein